MELTTHTLPASGLSKGTATPLSLLHANILLMHVTGNTIKTSHEITQNTYFKNIDSTAFVEMLIQFYG